MVHALISSMIPFVSMRLGKSSVNSSVHCMAGRYYMRAFGISEFLHRHDRPHGIWELG